MAIFDEPSRQPLPQPTFEDVTHASRQGLVQMVPLVGGPASELLALLGSPVARRRDAWLEDLERRLRELEEDESGGFRFDDLRHNEEFVSAVLQATLAALRTHQTEKREALRNAVLNVAAGAGPSEDLQLVFLNLVDTFTRTHLRVLGYFEHRDQATLDGLRSQRELSDQAVRDLRDRGLISDTRPYVARSRDATGSLLVEPWRISNLGMEFVAFITSPERKRGTPPRDAG